MTTEQQYRYVETYLAEIQPLMHLRDWKITLDREPPLEQDAGAEVQIVYGRKLARVRICSEFGTFDANEQKEQLVHELVHCHQDQLRIALDTVKETLGTTAYVAFREAFKFALEHATDAIADSLAQFMPDFVWPDGDTNAIRQESN